MAITKSVDFYVQLAQNTQDIHDLKYKQLAESFSNIKVLYECATYQELETYTPEATEENYGIGSLVGTTGNKILYVWTRATEGAEGEDEPHWVAIGAYQGPQGEQGEQGLTGKDGESATVAVGQVSSGDTASVSNVGTNVHAIFNFVLPVGPQGPTGSQGYSIDRISYYSTDGLIDYYNCYNTNNTLVGTIQVKNGADGANGTDGHSLTFKAPISNESLLPSPSVTYAGYAYLVGSASPYTVYICTLQDDNSYLWVNCGSITQGPQGNQGEQGEGINTLDNVVLNGYIYSQATYTDGLFTCPCTMTYNYGSYSKNVTSYIYLPVSFGAALSASVGTDNKLAIILDQTAITQCNKGSFGTVVTANVNSDYQDWDSDEVPTCGSVEDYVDYKLAAKYAHDIQVIAYYSSTPSSGYAKAIQLSFKLINGVSTSYANSATSGMLTLLAAINAAGYNAYNKLLSVSGIAYNASSSEVKPLGIRAVAGASVGTMYIYYASSITSSSLSYIQLATNTNLTASTIQDTVYKII